MLLKRRHTYLDTEIEKKTYHLIVWAWFNIFRETSIQKLEKEIVEPDNSIEKYKEPIKKMKDSIKNKEVELMQYVNLLNQKSRTWETGK